jgi:hypothetical protein
VSTGRPEEVGELIGGATAGVDDVAAALSASWRAAPREGPPETGAGGSMQYDLSTLFDAHAGAAEAPAGPQADASDSGGPWQAVPLFTMPSAGPAPPVAVPEYFGLRVAGVLCVVAGGACLVGSAALAAAVIAGILLGRNLVGPLGGATGLAAAVGLLVAGVMQIGLGTVALCLRDLARQGRRPDRP